MSNLAIKEHDTDYSVYKHISNVQNTKTPK